MPFYYFDSGCILVFTLSEPPLASPKKIGQQRLVPDDDDDLNDDVKIS